MSAVPSSTTYGGKWQPLSAPVDPQETQIRIRAQSILSGGEIGQCPPLSITQARDVLAWYRPSGWTDWKPPIYRLNRPQH